MRARAIGAGVVCACALFAQRARDAHGDDDRDLSQLSLEELLNVSVTTPTRGDEQLSAAPATVIVLTRADLEERGYHQLADILDDLPGMDVSRGWGDNWYMMYWRGNRSYFVPYLVMLDGLVMNELWTHDDAHHMVGYPLASVERVEIVYGPSSATYGRNAFMGVINVITSTDRARDGSYASATVSGGSLGRRIADLGFLYQDADLRVRGSFRFDSGNADDRTNGDYELTRRDYYQDRRLWGGFLDNPSFAGFHSAHRFTGVDLRVDIGDSEVGAYLLSHVSGYGVVYAGDRVLTNAAWYRRELSLHARHQWRLGRWGDATTTVRYRESGFPNDSEFIDGYQDPMLGRVAALSRWQSMSYSWSLFHDVRLRPPIDGLTVTAGLAYEEKDLAKAYEVTGPPYMPVDQITADGYPYPDPPPASRQPQNRIVTDDVGVYAEARYVVADAHRVHLGARLDHNTAYGFTPTVRGGYVGTFDAVVVKALYGEAYQEPTARTLYGGWTGAGSDPSLEPERSRTVELGASWTRPCLSTALTSYYVRTTNAIEVGSGIDGTSYARNIGTRDVVGLEASVQSLLDVPGLQRTRAWAYYTRTFLKKERRLDPASDQTIRDNIGDIADDKVQAGVTATVDDHLLGTLRGRWIGQRDTVYTNPIGSVPGYVTLDAFVRYRNLFVHGLALGLSIDNLTGAHYMHPGYADAAAGDTPGVFAPDGSYSGGSASLYNSLMPQPGRTFLLSLSLDRW